MNELEELMRNSGNMSAIEKKEAYYRLKNIYGEAALKEMLYRLKNTYGEVATKDINSYAKKL